jgi:16S rRNA (uracil1498-N3)-methyltransferase
VTLPVFAVPTLDGVRPGDSLELDGSEGRHAVVVKRLRVGEGLVLTDGAGSAATCTVTAVSRSSLVAAVSQVAATPVETPRVTVVQAIPKGERGELAVEMLTEVGVDVIVPWSAARSVGVWRSDRADKALSRWRRAAREAAKQARRTRFPEVTPPATTEEVAALLASASVRVVLHEAASGPLADVPIPGRAEIVVVVGPEGGITDEELAAFAAVGAEPLRMGSSVLRTSTAGVAAVAALLARTPRWR